MAKHQLSKAMFSAIFASCMLLSSTSLFAQVKIGTNPTTINAANNLEVEAATNGRKTSVNKTTGQVTIADGTEGVKKVLTSDANGGASWQTQSTGKLVLGGMPDNQTSLITLPADGTKTYLGASITLPPGKWLINVSCAFYVSTATSGKVNLQAVLSSSQTSFVPPTSLSNPIVPGFISGVLLTEFSQVHNLGTPMILEVSTATTYYVLGFVASNVGAPGIPGEATMSRVLSGTEYFFAQSLDY